MRLFSLATTIVLAGLIGTTGVGCNKNKTTEGPAGEKLKVSAPNESVKQGDKTDMTVKIERGKIADAVDISFANLPAGVTIVPAMAKIDKDKSEARFVLTAAANAGVVDGKEAKVMAKAGSMENTNTFKVTVTKKK